MIVLDTHVVSEAMKPEANSAVRAWLNEQVADTSVTLADMLFGIAVLPPGSHFVYHQLIQVARHDSVEIGAQLLAFRRPLIDAAVTPPIADQKEAPALHGAVARCPGAGLENAAGQCIRRRSGRSRSISQTSRGRCWLHPTCPRPCSHHSSTARLPTPAARQ